MSTASLRVKFSNLRFFLSAWLVATAFAALLLLASGYDVVLALSAMLHMEKYGTTKDQLLKVAVKNHENGFYNPKAHLRRRITLDQAKSAPMVSYPLNVFDCCVKHFDCCFSVFACSFNFLHV